MMYVYTKKVRHVLAMLQFDGTYYALMPPGRRSQFQDGSSFVSTPGVSSDGSCNFINGTFWSELTARMGTSSTRLSSSTVLCQQPRKKPRFKIDRR